MPSAVDIPSFASTQLSLLAAELAAELAETNTFTSSLAPSTLARAGAAVLNLHVASQRTGLGGKTVLELELDPAVVDSGGSGGGGEIPEHGIRTGDIVGVREQVGGAAKKREKSEVARKGVEGVVLRVGGKGIAVAVEKGEEEVDVGGGRVWLIRLANDVTHKRMKETMTRLEKLSESDCTPFIRILFGQGTPSPVPGDLSTVIPEDEWISENLNDSQKEAIRFSLASREVALIHGPPGTGKSSSVIELILQMVKRGQRLLVCGPSNISVDNIVERLAPHKVPMVRLGHPARLLPSVLNHSLEILTKTSEAAVIVQDVRREMDAKQASIRKTRNGRERKAIYMDIKELRKEYRERERNCIANLVKGSKVVLATLHGAGSFHLKAERFDAVIIDEASQALEAQCWIPLLTAKKVVLAGDHLQLPPTVKSLNSSAKGAQAPTTAPVKGSSLETTLFDRLLKMHGPSIKRMLTTQYRMHEKIMAFPSAELYESKLIAAESVKARLLKDLPYGVHDTDDTREPLIFFDTQGGDFPEQQEDEDNVGKRPGKGLSLGESKSNESEAMLVKAHVSRLVAAGVRPEDIAVVTPYNAQLAVLARLLKDAYPGIELGSVDGFQGREKEVVILTLVRSNQAHEVGFLAEKRRLNVAMTRPKRQLCVIGDAETVGKGSAFLKNWMAYLEEAADLRYPTLDDVAAKCETR